MARSYNSIVMDFREARRQADQMDQVADRMSELVNHRLGESLNNLSQIWKGENSSKYIAKGRMLQDNMDRTRRSLYETAAAIREIAQTIYDAEMEAWEQAHSRD